MTQLSLAAVGSADPVECESKFQPVHASEPRIIQSAANVEKLVNEYYSWGLKLAVKRWGAIAAKNGVDVTDLHSVANFCILRAAQTFDPQGGKSFQGWLTWWFQSYIGRDIRKAVERMATESSTEQGIPGYGDDDLTLGSSITYHDPWSQTPEAVAIAAETKSKTRELVERFERMLRADERKVFQLRFDLEEGEHARTLEEVGRELGVGREAIRKMQLRIQEKFRQFLQTSKNLDTLSASSLRARARHFLKGRSRGERAIFAARIATSRPASLEAVANALGMLPGAAMNVEKALRLAIVDYESAILSIEEGLGEHEAVILAELVLSLKPAKQGDVAKRIGMSETYVSKTKVRLEEILDLYVDPIIALKKAGKTVTAFALQAELVKSGSSRSIRDISGDLGLNPYLDFHEATELFISGQREAWQKLIRLRIVTAERADSEAVIAATGLSHTRVFHAEAELRKRMDRFVPVMQKLIDQKKPVTPENVTAELRASGIQVDPATVAEQLGYNPYRGMERALQVFRGLLGSMELDILDHRLLTNDQITMEALAERHGTTVNGIYSSQRELESRLEQGLPVFHELLEKSQPITAETVAEGLAARGVKKSLKDVRRIFRLGKKGSYAGKEKAIAVIRENLRADEKAVLDEMFLAAAPKTASELARQLAVPRATVLSTSARLTEKLKRYIPPVELLLAQGKPISADGIREAMFALGLEPIGVTMIKNTLGLKDPPVATQYVEALKIFSELIDPAKRAVLEQRILADKPRGIEQIGNDLGVHKTQVTFLERRLEQLLPQYLPAIEALRARGIEVNYDTLAEQLGQPLTGAKVKYSLLGKKLGR